jgi:hypothetical protein
MTTRGQGGLRVELADVVEALVRASEDAREVSLDAIGEAIGTRAASAEEIELVFSSLEARGRRIVGPEGGGGEERLKRVVHGARAFAAEHGRRATVAEIAAHTGLTELEVRHALALAKVMQR